MMRKNRQDFSKQLELGNPSRRRILNALAFLPFAGAFTRKLHPPVERPPKPGPSLQKPHIAVIGAGAFGGWTALYLLRQGARVTLLDAWGAGNSRASSGGETRVIRSIYGPDRIYVGLVRRAFELWQENQKRWKTRLYHRTGSLWMFSADDAYAKGSLPLAAEFGFEIETLSLVQAQRRYPQINFDGVHTVYYEHEAGYLTARR